MNQQEFQKIIDRIQAIWPAFKCEESTAREWYKQLGQFKYRDTDDAVTFLSKEDKFPPAMSAIFGALTKLNRKEKNYFRQNRVERCESAQYETNAGRLKVRLDAVDAEGRHEEAWEEKFRTVWDKRLGCRRRKIDFVCEYMGGAAVEKEIRSITGTKTLTELVGSPNWTARYLDKLNEMVKTVTDLGF